MRVVVVISGGLDSVTLAHFLASKGHELVAIAFDYGQRHQRELDYAEGAASRLEAEFIKIDLAAAGIGQILNGSALTDAAVPVPDGHYAAETMRSTVVPNRNAIMLAIACAAGVTRRADEVALGVHSGDHPIYPDCRPDFIRAFDAMEGLALEGMSQLRVTAPFVEKSKAEIVSLGAALKVPFELTWSCYKGGQLHCGECGTCVERREAFQLADVPDPTSYLSTAPIPTLANQRNLATGVHD